MRARRVTILILVSVALSAAVPGQAAEVGTAECRSTLPSTTCSTTFELNATSLSRIDVQADYTNTAVVGDIIVQWHDAQGRRVAEWYCITANAVGTGSASRGLTCFLTSQATYYYLGTQTLTVTANGYVGVCPSICQVRGKLSIFN